MSNVNFKQEWVEGVRVWVSYNTIVAFFTDCGDLVCSENVWSNTTGRHIASICVKNERISYINFKQLLENTISCKSLNRYAS